MRRIPSKCVIGDTVGILKTWPMEIIVPPHGFVHSPGDSAVVVVKASVIALIPVNRKTIENILKFYKFNRVPNRRAMHSS